MNFLQNNVLIYSRKMTEFEYGENHPFKPERGRQFMELLNRYSLLSGADRKIIEPEPIDENLLLLFHTKNYINLLKKSERGGFTIGMFESGIGNRDNPVVSGMFEHASIAAGGTYLAAKMMIDGSARFVFNPHGGFHHAYPDRAEGFCFINDVAIAITELVNRGLKVAYIDLDVHHGNGVQDAFYATDRVLTISLHESGKTLYPWSGFENELGIDAGEGYNINIPLLEGSDDEVYLYAYLSIVPDLITAFKPDVVFVEAGGDAHKNDPLGNLNVTNYSFRKIFDSINSMAPKIIATGGGGYNAFKTAVIWTLAWSAFSGAPLDDMYSGSTGGMMFGPESDIINLETMPFISKGAKKEKSMTECADVINYLKKFSFLKKG